LNVDHAACLRTILMADSIRWRALGAAASLGLPDCWIGAGLIRNAVWDHLHRRPPRPPYGDVDVLWFDRGRSDPSEDIALEAILRALDPSLDWSVRNQARMHARNNDPPYASATDAMRRWPETATAVAVRRIGPADCEIAAPFGLDDLFALAVRPTPRFGGVKHSAYLARVEAKGWSATWPQLRIEMVGRPCPADGSSPEPNATLLPKPPATL
jgi:hypothetical protein